MIPSSLAAQERVSIPTPDGGLIWADIYGAGSRGVVLAHGGRFDRASWATQARLLADAGFRAIAIEFRGEGASHGGAPMRPGDDGYHFDVLGAVRYLRRTGAARVFVIGASLGGDAAAEAAVEAAPGEIDRLVLLAGGAIDTPARMQGSKLFIIARDDANADGLRLPRFRTRYDRTPGPKRLIIVDGAAHAQFLFATGQADRVMGEILRFLGAP
ncbi:MAG: alpha/beta fold hydrolase [Gemmatimonadaceae bacterium]